MGGGTHCGGVYLLDDCLHTAARFAIKQPPAVNGAFLAVLCVDFQNKSKLLIR